MGMRMGVMVVGPDLVGMGMPMVVIVVARIAFVGGFTRILVASFSVAVV